MSPDNKKPVSQLSGLRFGAASLILLKTALVLELLQGVVGLAQPAGLQALSGNGSGSQQQRQQTIVDREQEVIETAVDSFREAAKRLYDTVLQPRQFVSAANHPNSESIGSDQPAKERPGGKSPEPSESSESDEQGQASLQPLVEEHVQAFASAAEDEILNLKGDGVISVGELTAALRDLRENRLDRLEEILQAKRDGAPPPPLRTADQPYYTYVERLLTYTIVQRNAWQTWLLFFGCIVAGFVVASGLGWAFRKAAAKASERDRSIARQSLQSVVGPAYLACIACGLAIGLKQIWIPLEITEFLRVTLKLLFAVAGLWLAWSLCGALASLIQVATGNTPSQLDDQMVDIVRKALRLSALVVFALVVTEVVFSTDVKGVLAGLGILGLAVTLASQDSLKNLFGSFTIYGDRPFRIKDLIIFKGHFGRIEEIGFRSTKLRRLDGHLVTIPNAEISKEPIENVSARPSIRHRFHLDLTYDTPPASVRKAMEIIKEILDESGILWEEQPTRIFFESFGEHSLRLFVQYYHYPAEYWESLEARSDIHLKILERFTREDIEFAFPTRTLHIDKDPTALPTQLSASSEDSPSSHESHRPQGNNGHSRQWQPEASNH